jgi:hypothetical protein
LPATSADKAREPSLVRIRSKIMTQHRRPDGIDLAARSRARRRATQALYAWQMSGNPMNLVIDEFRYERGRGEPI